MFEKDMSQNASLHTHTHTHTHRHTHTHTHTHTHIYIYKCNHKENVPSQLSPQWLCGNTMALSTLWFIGTSDL